MSDRTGTSVGRRYAWPVAAIAAVTTIGGGAWVGSGATQSAQPLTGSEYSAASAIYFQRCAGCHGTLREGAIGPALLPPKMQAFGTPTIEAIVHNGLARGMPPFGRSGILTPRQINLVARYLQMPVPEPPRLSLEEIRSSWRVMVPVADRPTRPTGRGDWRNYTGVILRDARRVAIIDADTKRRVALVDTGYAVHILRSSATGRYFYAIGRDGRITLIDLWSPTPTAVAEVRGCLDARSVEASKFAGYEDRLLIEGCYSPQQYVVFDGLTLEPQALQQYPTASVDDGSPLPEVRVAAIVADPHAPRWVMALKESGYVALVDYSAPGFPISTMIPGQRFLHDGGLDHTGRYMALAANERNQIVVVDLAQGRRVARIRTGRTPHPGRGANWKDPRFGWVMATTHIGEGKLTIYGADPARSPRYAWKVVRQVRLPSAGTLFLKTHPRSPWVWTDATLSTDPEAARTVCVYSKARGRLHRCFPISTYGRATHIEYNRQGTEVWISNWHRRGEIVVYDDRSLKPIRRIRGSWLRTPTGKFNVTNTSRDVY